MHNLLGKNGHTRSFHDAHAVASAYHEANTNKNYGHVQQATGKVHIVTLEHV